MEGPVVPEGSTALQVGLYSSCGSSGVQLHNGDFSWEMKTQIGKSSWETGGVTGEGVTPEELWPDSV